MELNYWQRFMQLFSSPFTSNKENHGRVWSLIFKSSKWVSKLLKKGFNPFLIGFDLQELYHNTKKPVHLVLISGDIEGGVYEKDLLESLQPHEVNRSTMEIKFKNTNITLNIEQPIHNRTFTTLSPRKLFSPLENSHSHALYWADTHYQLQRIRPEDVCGLDLDGVKDTSRICGLLIKDPENQQEELQLCFQDLDCPPVNPIFSQGQCKSHVCVGWKLARWPVFES